MPIKFKFQEKIQGLYVYQFISDQKTIVDVDWVYLMRDWMTKPNPPNYMFGDEHREEFALYLGFAWALSQGLNRFVIPNYYRDDAAKHAELPFHFVNWEYQVEVNVKPLNAVDKGFVNARACVQGLHFSSDWEMAHQHEAGLFSVRAFVELTKLHEATLTDASSEISMFCLKPDRDKDLIELLSHPQKPDLSNFLNKDELFIDIVLGIDMGYGDSILIKSPTDISAKIRSLSMQFEKTVTEYEKESAQTQSFETALVRLYELSQGEISS